MLLSKRSTQSCLEQGSNILENPEKDYVVHVVEGGVRHIVGLDYTCHAQYYGPMDSFIVRSHESLEQLIDGYEFSHLVSMHHSTTIRVTELTATLKIIMESKGVEGLTRFLRNTDQTANLLNKRGGFKRGSMKTRVARNLLQKFFNDVRDISYSGISHSFYLGSEAQYAAELNVSTSTLRTCLRELKSEGVVTSTNKHNMISIDPTVIRDRYKGLFQSECQSWNERFASHYEMVVTQYINQ